MNLRTISKSVLLFAACATLYTSCSEDEDPSIIGSWKFTGAVFNPAITMDSTEITDAYSLFFPQACDRDDYFILQENGVQINDAGATLCNVGETQRDTSAYNYSGTTLTMLSADGDTNGIITNVSITKTNLTGKFSAEFGGAARNIDVTLTRQ